MKSFFLYILIITTCFSSFSQIREQDTIKITAQDSAVLYAIELEEVVLSKGAELTEQQKKFLILKRRVYKTYPYAKLTAEKLTNLNATMAKLKTKKSKKNILK